MKHTTILFFAASLSMTLGGCKAMLGNGQSRSAKVTISVPFPPPQSKKERQPQRINPGHFWVGGYWEWLDITTSYQWRHGHFVRARKNWEYRYPQYRKLRGQWYFTKPHWRRRRILAQPPAPRQVHSVTPVNIKPPPVKKGEVQDQSPIRAAPAVNQAPAPPAADQTPKPQGPTHK